MSCLITLDKGRGVATWGPGGATALPGQRMATRCPPLSVKKRKKKILNRNGLKKAEIYALLV